MIFRLAMSRLRAKQPCPVNTRFLACPAANGRNAPIPEAPHGLSLAATARLPAGKLLLRYQAAVWPQSGRPLPLCSIARRRRIPNRVPDAAQVNLDVAATLLHIPFRLVASGGAQNSSLPLLGVPGRNRDIRQRECRSIAWKAAHWRARGSTANQDRQDGSPTQR